LKTADFDYHLPDELIAQTPLQDRSSSRLLVLDRRGEIVKHDVFSNLSAHLVKGDVLVFNDTKVLPARLIGLKRETRATIEVLLLKDEGHDVWETLVKPARRIRVGTVVGFGDGRLEAQCVAIGEEGIRKFRFRYQGIFLEVLDRLGEMPLPPYIHEQLQDKDRYQTVYAKESGSAAAPTAGLHFTSELFEQLKANGIELAFLTLHVGLGTFRPVAVDDVSTHKMHAEYYRLDAATATRLQAAKDEGRKIVAVGTTTTRTLETIVRDHGRFVEAGGWTDIFIYPGFAFRAIDGLITNFHLPKSTLLMLVSALCSKEAILRVYAEAVMEKYRFFSFGDAMLFLPDR
jgi:S-adenosylmethionine:tRNA ribosyltransferase-isomerase